MPLPGPVSVAKVQTVFDEEGNCTDPDIEWRISRVVTNLMDYIQDSVCPKPALEAVVRGQGQCLPRLLLLQIQLHDVRRPSGVTE